MVGHCAAHSIERDAGIEGDQPATVFHRQCQQIGVGDLLMAAPLGAVEHLCIRNCQIIGPKLMMTTGLGGGELSQDIQRRHRCGVARIGEHPQTAILGQRTRRPAGAEILRQPRMGAAMREVLAIQ